MTARLLLTKIAAPLVALTILFALAITRRREPAPAPVAPRPPLQLLAVSVARPAVTATLPVGAEPEGVAVSPDSRTVYVANQGERSLSVIDVASRYVTPVPLRNTARFVAVSRDGRRVYVSMFEKDRSGSGVAILDAATRRVISYLRTGTQPYDLAVAPDGRLWVPIHGSARLDVFSPDDRPAGQVRVAANPHSVGFAAAGSRAFTPDHESNRVSVIDTRTDRRTGSIPVSSAPHSLDVAPDGRTVAVACYGANAVDLIDAVTLRRRGPFAVGRKPQSVAVSADSAHAYVVNEEDNTVSVMAIRSGTVTATLRVGRSPRTVAVAPDGRSAYVTNGDDNTVSILQIGQSTSRAIERPPSPPE
ncbi:YncE family protein [Actinoplanes sp. NPDC049596]|uniref:YncE family protein n=1 Tax=unclassified Actinoplanes TaxID=2626549 RepID=UPI003441D9B7